MFDAASALVSTTLARFLDPQDPFSLYSLIGALGCLLLYYALKRGRSAFSRVRAFARAAFPKRILLHPSSILDYKLFVATSLLYAVSWSAAIASSEWVKSGVLSALTLIAPAAQAQDAGWPLIALVTISFVLVLEFNYWLAHWAMHRFEALWAFHKLHHSAEVMTPMTEWRQHPGELVLFPTVQSLGLGSFYALMVWLFGPGVTMFTLFETNILLLALTCSILHLRHTHLQIAARGWLGCIIQSPLHHQVHHSVDPAHLGKNLGLCLSIWDWAFGTLYIPKANEKLTLGVEGVKHEGVLAAYAEPFADLASQAGAALMGPRQANRP
jgi:sterol desaturase/sphingolipid hydroxylase (fatty acid hydroxylase superfamily)